MKEELSPVFLLSAIKEGNIASVRDFFEAQPEAINDHTFIAGRTWLAYAVSKGMMGIVQELIRLGADINKVDKHFGTNALHTACLDGQLEMVEFLLEAGVKMDISNSTRNPLFGSIKAGSPEIAALLLANDIDTTKAYVLGVKTNPPLDAVAYAMMWGQREIAHAVALHNSDGDEARAAEAMAEGLRLAELTTSD